MLTPEASVAQPATAIVEEEDQDDDDVDESGVEAKDVELVMTQVREYGLRSGLGLNLEASITGTVSVSGEGVRYGSVRPSVRVRVMVRLRVRVSAPSVRPSIIALLQGRR